MPSYEISAPEKSPVFDCKLSYQRARRSIYPYALNDNLYARKSEVKSWKALFLAVNGTRRGTLAVKVEKKGKTVFEKQVEQVGRKGAL